jgi:hypothetical protein
MFAKSFCSRAGTAVRYGSNRATMRLRAKVKNPVFAGKAQVRKPPTQLGLES